MTGRVHGAHRLYQIVWWPLSWLVMAWLWWRGRKEPAYRQHLHERWGGVTAHPSAMGGVWIHAASVGEVQAALTLLPGIEAAWGAHAVRWTVQTPAGRDLLLERTQGRACVTYAPLDHPWAVRRFLRAAQPRLLVLLERELWPEWLRQCEQAAIGVVVVNARLTERHGQRGGWLHRVLAPRWRHLQWVACADAASADRFRAHGVAAHRVCTTGNLKFDGATGAADRTTTPGPWPGRRVVVAASTHADDEAALLACWPRLADPMPDALLVLAPRHRPRFDDVAQALAQHGLRYVRYSRQEPVSPDTQVLLLDTLGDLASCYAHADLALMGGTWARVGGHSPLEAMAQGCPVLMGPHTHQFPDLYDAILSSQAGERVPEAHLDQALYAWLADGERRQRAGARAREFWRSQQGAHQRTMEVLTRLPTWPQHPMAPVTVRTQGSAVEWWSTTPTTGFDAEATGDHLPTGSGRGAVIRLRREGGDWLWRHYRRGGLVARWNHDRYRRAPVHQTRAMQEMTLLREMVSLGLPVPRAVAARCIHAGRHYTADIIVEFLPGTQNLAQILRTRPLTDAEWTAVGRGIRRMHDHQIYHSDLNCHNILIDADGGVWLIDFDKCERRGGEGWKADNIQRLLRSIRKVCPPDYPDVAIHLLTTPPPAAA